MPIYAKFLVIFVEFDKNALEIGQSQSGIVTLNIKCWCEATDKPDCFNETTRRIWDGVTSARLVVSQTYSQSVGMRVSVLICHQMARVSQCAWEFIAKVIWCVDRGRSNNNNNNFLYCMCFSSLVETSIKQSEHKSFVFFSSSLRLFFVYCSVKSWCIVHGRKRESWKSVNARE